MTTSSKTANAANTNDTPETPENSTPDVPTVPQAAPDYSGLSVEDLTAFRDGIRAVLDVSAERMREMAGVLAGIETELAVRPKGQ